MCGTYRLESLMTRHRRLVGSHRLIKRIFTTQAIVLASIVTAIDASTNNDAVVAVYGMLPDVLAWKTTSPPLIFPWSTPNFVAERDTIAVSGTFTRSMTHYAINEYVWKRSRATGRGTFREHAKGLVFVEEDDEGHLRHETVFRVANWNVMPSNGIWRVRTSDGRQWCGDLECPVADNGNRVPTDFEERIVKDVLRRLPDRANRSNFINFCAQLDGIFPVQSASSTANGIFVAGYIVNGQRAGLWLTARTSGYLQIEYYVAGNPCGIQIVSGFGFPGYVQSFPSHSKYTVSLYFVQGHIATLDCFGNSATNLWEPIVKANWQNAKLNTIWLESDGRGTNGVDIIWPIMPGGAPPK